MIEELKEVKINELSIDEIENHRKEVLTLEKDSVLEYLKYALDTFYKSEEEGENEENVDTFFDSDDFLEYYQLLEKENNA